MLRVPIDGVGWMSQRVLERTPGYYYATARYLPTHPHIYHPIGQCHPKSLTNPDKSHSYTQVDANARSHFNCNFVFPSSAGRRYPAHPVIYAGLSNNVIRTILS